MLKLKDLVKSDRRREWSTLKGKYGKLLAAHKIDFDAKFGPLLDKYQVQLKTVEKLYAQDAVTPPAVEKVLVAARPLANVADAYRAKVKGRGGPLEKDVTAFLKEIEGECADWEKALDLVASESVHGRNTPAQLKAVKEVYGVLDALGQGLINLTRSLPDMQNRAKKIPGEAKYATYLKLLEDEPKKVVLEKEWRRVLAADMGMMESHATVLGGMARTADAACKRLVAGCVKFDERSDYAALKSLADSFASSAAMKGFKARALAMEQWMKGVVEVREDYQKGPMAIAGSDMKDIRRAAISAAETGAKLVDPAIASIRRMP